MSRFRTLGLAAGFVITLGLLPLFHLAPNRLVVGTPIMAQAALGFWAMPIAAAAVLGAGAFDLGRGRAATCLGLALTAAALVLFASALGSAAADLTAGQPSATRARLASGAWIGLMLLGGIVASGVAQLRAKSLGWLALAALFVAFALLAWAGRFDALSVTVEYRARSSAVHQGLVEHLALCLGSVALALVATVLLAASRPVRGLVDLAISGVQVVPAVALLGALVALVSSLLTAFPALRDLGLGALGPSPAILAVAAYLLLPLWRGLHAGLAAPDPATLDAATAIGLTPRQILFGVRLPLGAPILVGALRVACVQSIGLATLGALVGAGGLGAIVFDGMAQFAPDLILLGAIPVIALSLLADRSLSLAEAAARRRWRG